MVGLNNRLDGMEWSMREIKAEVKGLKDNAKDILEVLRSQQ